MPMLVLLWVWACAYLNCAGWLLSALHQLNPGGYAVVLLLGAATLLVWQKQSGLPAVPKIHWAKIRRRFRRPFPLVFLILAALAFLGGVLYAPSNYDALAYRIPRILHWLAAGQWHWIHTDFPRLNTRSCGTEWVSAPLIALLHTDRLLFLLSTISFLLLPGLVFSVFTRLGVRRRVAWHWMWLFPSGYGFVVQAGSIGNDLFGAVFVLAAMQFALRAKATRAPADFFTAIVAAGMMTACKLSNLTLLLPWVLAMLPSVPLALRWPVRTVGVCALALVASVLPTIVENFRHCGDWTGMAVEQPGMIKSPVFKTALNIALAIEQNIDPPFCPVAGVWNEFIDQRLPSGLTARIDRTMESHQCNFYLEQMQIEENAGLGLGLSLLLVAGTGAALLTRQKKSGGSVWLTCVLWSPFISLLALLTQSNLYPVARLLSPYYGLLLPPLLALGGHEIVVRKRWWRLLGLAVFASAACLLVLSPPRPLFPVQTILGQMKNPPTRLQAVYSVYRERNDAFAPVRATLPNDLKVLGFVTFDDPETSLWRPFGARRVEHVTREDTAADLKARGIEYILVKPEAFSGKWLDGTREEWCQRMNAEVVQTIPLHLRAARGPEDWFLFRLR